MATSKKYDFKEIHFNDLKLDLYNPLNPQAI